MTILQKKKYEYDEPLVAETTEEKAFLVTLTTFEMAELLIGGE